MDDPIVTEGMPPSPEHGARNLIAFIKRPPPVLKEFSSIEPGHRKHAIGGKLRQDIRNSHVRVV